ncbi:MAG: serine/threonine protein kinase [Deltaproteobacteria bacterium]|nr:serine/threonine protein kinase [Deltaproteobacteria bacterium]
MVQVGDTLGSYELVTHLKSGGMAALYLARRQGAAGFARYVAIKIVHPHLAKDETFQKMFVAEALLSVRIDHPNVVHVEELGEVDGTFYLVMEYVRGTSLAHFLKRLMEFDTALSPALAVYIAMQVAEGLHAAHETTDDDGNPLKVVHRDVSPQNILVAYRGNVKLIDFGIAHAEGRELLTRTGTLRGKIRYMSPEQGLGRKIDRRADVYALGVILWEMLTSRRLVEADEELAALNFVQKPEIVPPGQLVDGIPPALDRVVLDALALDPSKRIQTAQELWRRLAQAVPGALEVEPSVLAELLTIALADEIDTEKHVLPESMSGVLVGALGREAGASLESTGTGERRRARARSAATSEGPLKLHPRLAKLTRGVPEVRPNPVYPSGAAAPRVRLGPDDPTPTTGDRSGARLRKADAEAPPARAIPPPPPPSAPRASDPALPRAAPAVEPDPNLDRFTPLVSLAAVDATAPRSPADVIGTRRGSVVVAVAAVISAVIVAAGAAIGWFARGEVTSQGGAPAASTTTTPATPAPSEAATAADPPTSGTVGASADPPRPRGPSATTPSTAVAAEDDGSDPGAEALDDPERSSSARGRGTRSRRRSGTVAPSRAEPPASPPSAPRSGGRRRPLIVPEDW